MSKERVNYWYNQKGVSLRIIGGFYDKSHEAIKQKIRRGGSNEERDNQLLGIATSGRYVGVIYLLRSERMKQNSL
jgi:hypothetical protein